MEARDDLERRLLESQPDLTRYVARHAGSRLLRFETVEDLVQGVHLEALKSAGTFEYRGEAEFQGWLFRVARHYLYNRAAYWYAMKRDSGGLLRLIARETGGIDPPATATSPSSFAGRREQVVLMTRALAALRPKDRDLLGRCLEGASIEELAAELGLTYEAAKRARLRAMERLKKALALGR